MTQRILLQFDPDPHASSFDAIAAVDAGVEQLLSYAHVTPRAAVALTHGAIFTRSAKKLANTAIFVGGSNVEEAEAVHAAVQSSFVGPLQVSTMLDPNGANTTAAAAVWCAQQHGALAGAVAMILGGTGPVGQRVARLLAAQGAKVLLASRSIERAAEACQRVQQHAPQASLTPMAAKDEASIIALLRDAHLLFACGATGVRFVGETAWATCEDLRAIVDVNAVPPLGVEGVQVHDFGELRHGAACYGALGVGGPKMKIHKEAIARLFRNNRTTFDAEQIFSLATEVL